MTDVADMRRTGCGSSFFVSRRRDPRAWYTVAMQDEIIFRRHAEDAIESVKKALIRAESQTENEGDFEVEEQNGVLNVVFEEPSAKFVITPNSPVQQIWISALSTSFKLNWDEVSATFVLPKTGESFYPLVVRLINEHLGVEAIPL